MIGYMVTYVAASTDRMSSDPRTPFQVKKRIFNIGVNKKSQSRSQNNMSREHTLAEIHKYFGFEFGNGMTLLAD